MSQVSDDITVTAIVRPSVFAAKAAVKAGHTLQIKQNGADHGSRRHAKHAFTYVSIYIFIYVFTYSFINSSTYLLKSIY